jgi:hypothetical protein
MLEVCATTTHCIVISPRQLKSPASAIDHNLGDSCRTVQVRIKKKVRSYAFWDALGTCRSCTAAWYGSRSRSDEEILSLDAL